MEFGIIITLVGIGMTMVGVMVAMMFWMRTEANDLRKEQKDDRDSFFTVLHSIQLDIEKGRK